MSTETETPPRRGYVDRLRASPFLSELFRNRIALLGLTIIILLVLVGVGSRLLLDVEALMKPQLSEGGTSMAGPCGERALTEILPAAFDGCAHPFGTDIHARDIFLRTQYGAWLALKFGTITVVTATVLGVIFGVVAAYYGDVVDNTIMRTMDVLLAFPSLLLALALVAILGSGLWKAVLALILVYTPQFARVVRGAALKVIEDEYVDATVALGATDVRVLGRHVVPNTLAPITVQATLTYGLTIIDLAALSFLGFGASPGTPDWGIMLSEGVDSGLYSGHWWWSFFPGLYLAIAVLGFNLLGDGMRDALDPRMRSAID
ncbi:MAG: ABC transporter permease [Halobacteriales archaeon]